MFRLIGGRRGRTIDKIIHRSKLYKTEEKIIKPTPKRQNYVIPNLFRNL